MEDDELKNVYHVSKTLAISVANLCEAVNVVAFHDITIILFS